MGRRAGAVQRLAARLRPDVIIERYYNFGGEGIGAAARVGATAVLEVNAPVIDYPGSAKARLDRALLVEPMRRWRERICARADVIVTPSAAILPPGTPPIEDRRDRMGRRHRTFPSRRSRTGAVRAAGRSWWRCLPALSAAGMALSTSPLRLRELHARGPSTISARCSSATGRSWRAVQSRRAGVDGVIFTGALPHDRMPACLAACGHRRRAVRRRPPRAAVARLLLVAAEDLRIHGGRSAGCCARDRGEFPHSSSTVARASSTTASEHGRAGRARSHAGRRSAAAAARGQPRGRAPFATTVGQRTAGRSTTRFEAARRRTHAPAHK